LSSGLNWFCQRITKRRGDEVRRLEQIQVLCHPLPRHVQVSAQLIQCAAVMRIQQVQEPAPAWIGQRVEKHVGVIEASGHGSL
jgi:hypothetical protein